MVCLSISITRERLLLCENIYIYLKSFLRCPIVLCSEEEGGEVAVVCVATRRITASSSWQVRGAL